MIETSQGKNSQVRYNKIKDSVSSFKGKTLLDIGCENGYFCAKFLGDGGKSAVGVEINEDSRRKCEALQLTNLTILKDISEVTGKFDFCFYLSLHYHNDINYLPKIKGKCKVLFAETSGSPTVSSSRNDKFQLELKEYFDNVEEVCFTDYANRKVFKCY